MGCCSQAWELKCCSGSRSLAVSLALREKCQGWTGAEQAQGEWESELDKTSFTLWDLTWSQIESLFTWWTGKVQGRNHFLGLGKNVSGVVGLAGYDLAKKAHTGGGCGKVVGKSWKRGKGPSETDSQSWKRTSSSGILRGVRDKVVNER